MVCIMRSLIALVFCSVVARGFEEQKVLLDHHGGIKIASEWEVLGPFQSGTREQQWGADPLELYGGFHNITFSHDPFPSTLNGTVYFQHIKASPTETTKNLLHRRIPVTFPNVNWHGLQEVFGWSALQFQSWIRGSINIPLSGRYGLWIGSAVEYYLDGVYYDTGNLYDGDITTYSRGGVFLHLEEGEHLFEIRVVNDIRASGGQVPPKVDVKVALKRVVEELVVADYESFGGWIVPSVVMGTGRSGKEGGCLAGEWGSLAVRNEGSEKILITEIQVNEVLSPLSVLTHFRDRLKLIYQMNRFISSQANNGPSQYISPTSTIPTS